MCMQVPAVEREPTEELSPNEWQEHVSVSHVISQCILHSKTLPTPCTLPPVVHR